MNGARVLNKPVLPYDKHKPCTQGNYLLMLRKGASKINLDIASKSLQEDLNEAYFNMHMCRFMNNLSIHFS